MSFGKQSLRFWSLWGADRTRTLYQGGCAVQKGQGNDGVQEIREAVREAVRDPHHDQWIGKVERSYFALCPARRYLTLSFLIRGYGRRSVGGTYYLGCVHRSPRSQTVARPRLQRGERVLPRTHPLSLRTTLTATLKLWLSSILTNVWFIQIYE